MKVLIVDDSSIFRTQIKKALEMLPNVEVVGTASNGKIALQILEQKKIDLVTLEMEMAEMNGIETLKAIRAANYKVHTIMFASKSPSSADIAVKAFSVGADDFVLKPQIKIFSIDQAFDSINSQLIPLVNRLVKKQELKQKEEKQAFPSKIQTTQAISLYPKINVETFEPQAIVVASSTGGPLALETFFAQISKKPRVPIFLVQHMPEIFTQILSKRLTDTLGLNCREAIHNEEIQAGVIYVAPGNFHMKVVRKNGKNIITLDQETKVNSVRPAADLLFETASRLYGSACMGFVLTGMGEDGCVGCVHIKNAGGAIMIQDQETSVVWGMPGAVFQKGTFDKVGSISECARVLARVSKEFSF